MANLVSTLDIRLVDDVSKSAAQIEASLKKMEAEAKEVDAALGKSGTSDKMQAQLRKLGAQTPHIEAVAKAWKDYAAAEGIAAERGDWTAKQAAQVKNWESVNIAGIRAVMGAERAHEAARLAQIEKADAASKRAVEAQYRREEHLAHQREHMADHHGVVNYALTSAAMAVSAHEIAHIGREAWEQGSELQHERMQLKNAGRTPEEMKDIESASRNAIANIPTAGMIESMKVVAETTSAFGSVHHAIENLPFMMKAMSVLKSAGGDKIQGDAGTVGRYFAKTFEERQTRPEDFDKEARQMIPAMVASGGVFNPEQLYAFAQQAKSSLPNYDIRFLSKIAPSIITELGGERAGTAANAFTSIIMGKVNDKKQAEAFLHAGLLDPSKAVMKAGHAVGWQAGAIKNTNLALTDPLRWVEEVQNPALAKLGVNMMDRLDVAKALGTMYRNQNANLFANTLTQQASASRLHKDEGLYNKAGTLEEIYQNDLGEFTVAAGAVEESLKSLSAAATAPLMHPVAEALSSLSEGVNSVAKFGFEHPTMAATTGVGAIAAALGSAGWLGMKVMNGFGLKGSAIALDGAAASLEAAAGHLAVGGGGPGGVMNKIPGGAIVPAGGALAEGAAFSGAVTIGSAAVAGGIAVATIGLVKAASEAQEPGKGGLWSAPTYGTMALDQQRLADLQAERDDLRGKIAAAKAQEKLPGTSDAENYPRQQRLEQIEGPIAELAKRLDVLQKLPREDDRETRARAFVRPKDYVPLPPVRPGEIPREHDEEFGPPGPPPPVGIERRTFGAYLDAARPEAAAGTMPQAAPPVAPQVDTSPAEQGLMHLMSLSSDAGTHMQTALNVSASPTVDTASINAAQAAAERLVATLSQIGALAAGAAAAVAGAAAGGANAAVGARRSFQAPVAGNRITA